MKRYGLSDLIFGPLLTASLIVMSAHPAAATTTGISVLDTGVTAAANLLRGLAGLGALGFIGWSIWELFGHSNMKRAVTEFIIGVIFGIVSTQAAAICTAFGIGATTIG